MPKAPKSKEHLSKYNLFPSIRQKIDKVLEWRAGMLAGIQGKDLTDDEKDQIKDLEIQTKLKIMDITDCGKTLYEFYP